MSQRQRSQGFKRQQKLIPAKLGDITVLVPASQLKGKFVPHHGVTAGGVQVNSLATTIVGDSTIIRDDLGHTASFKTADLEVMMKDKLGAIGYAVVAPQAK